MHKIISVILTEFAQSFNFDEIASKNLEYFVNYLIVSSQIDERVQPIDITTGDDDASIDGIAILIDGEVINDLEEAKEIIAKTKRKLQVKLILTQVKSSEKFEKSEIANFLTGILAFLDESNNMPQGEFNQSRKEIFFYLLENVSRIQNNLPDLEVYYCTTGTYNAEREIKGVFDLIKSEVANKTFFNDIKVVPFGRAEIIALNGKIGQDVKARLTVKSYIALPESDNIPNSFLSLVSAKEFVDKLLFNEDKTDIRHSIFDENIRAYLGDSVVVNEKIQKSLEDLESRSIFAILNNGITIIAPEITVSPTTNVVIDITNYQIINGCQTSNVLFSNRELLDDKTSLIVKFINTQDADTINKIIASTNSQSHIEDKAFLSLKDKTKMVQQYFDSMNKDDSDNIIYFERRQNEYKNSLQNISRTFDLKSVVQAYNAMFLDSPHLSSRYVKQIFEEKELFQDNDSEAYYYIATLCLYKTQSLINSKKFKYSALKWHFLYLFKYLVIKSKNGYESNSNKASKNAEKLRSVLINRQKFDEKVELFNSIVNSLDFPTKDVLKRQRYSSELKDKAFELLNIS